VKVLYIISLSHSGSTLLDVMLNAHPDVFSVGELKQLNRFARLQKVNTRSNRCTCGAETVWTCPVWSKVNALAEAETGSDLGEINVENYSDEAGFNRDNVALFKAIAAVTGKKFIVDSSKQWLRLRLLIANPEIEVFPIFLLRNPKGQIWSSMRKRNAELSKFIHRYVASNRVSYNLVKDIPHAVVHYEDLVQYPQETLRGLMQQVGLDFDERQLHWAAQVRHNVGGNRMRWRQRSKLRMDETWRQGLTLVQKLAIDAGTLPGRYPFIKLGFRSPIRG
jgi:hypothetical protein